MQPSSHVQDYVQNQGQMSSQIKNQGLILLIIIASYFMIVVDISIVITGLPKIQQSLGFTTAGLSWVQNAYTLSFGGLLLLGARAGDIYGRKLMYMLGLLIFTLSSLAIGLASSAGWLLVFRAIQGSGSAILAPTTMALLSTNFAEGEARTKALSYYAAAAGVGATFGLVMGGIFADLLSWRAGFLINVPIGMMLIWGTQHFIRETPKHDGQLGLRGAVSSTLGMSLLVFGVVHAAESGWSQSLTQVTVASGLVLLGLFVLNESRAKQPIMPLRLFASRQRNGALLARLFFMSGIVGFWFFNTQYLQGVLSFTPFEAGLAFLPATIFQLIASFSVPFVARRIGTIMVMIYALIMAIIGLFWLGMASAHSHYLLNVALPMILIGLGNGALLAPLTMKAVEGVPHQDAGAASGLVNTVHQMGGALGLSLLVVVFSMAQPTTVFSQSSQAILAHQISLVMNTSALLLVLSLIVVVVMLGVPKQRQQVLS